MVEKNKKYKTRNVIIWVVSLTIVVILISSLLFIKQDQIDLGCHFIYDEEHHCITAHQIGLLFPFIIKQQPERKNIPPEVIDYVYRYVLLIHKFEWKPFHKSQSFGISRSSEDFGCR